MTNTNKKLRRQILAMAAEDKGIRQRQFGRIGIGSRPTRRMVTELRKLDHKHSSALKRMVRKYGWPGKSLVGTRGERAAWLLIQHADHDVTFQQKCLTLLRRAVRAGEAKKSHLAHLVDRVLIHNNKRQLYGTQFRRSPTGTFEPFPIASRHELARRRRRMGLTPFRKYKGLIKSGFRPRHQRQRPVRRRSLARFTCRYRQSTTHRSTKLMSGS